MKFTNEKGFTLVELLVVVAIIGILAAIAIPQFSAYRQKAFDGAAKSDLANLAIAQDAFYVDSQTYTTSTSLPSFNISKNVTVNISAATASAWTATATHSQSTNTWTWISDSGGATW